MQAQPASTPPIQAFLTTTELPSLQRRRLRLRSTTAMVLLLMKAVSGTVSVTMAALV